MSVMPCGRVWHREAVTLASACPQLFSVVPSPASRNPFVTNAAAVISCASLGSLFAMDALLRRTQLASRAATLALFTNAKQFLLTH